MSCPTFTQIFAGEQPAHVRSCPRCQQVVAAIQTVRQPPRGSAEFRRSVIARLHTRHRGWRLLTLVPVAAALVVYALTGRDDFQPRGGKAAPVSVDIVPQGPGYAVRVENTLDHDVFIGAYLKDAAGELHWLAPHWPSGTSAPALVRVKAYTQTSWLDTGVVPDMPAKGHGELVAFATDVQVPVETPITRLFERHTPVEVP